MTTMTARHPQRPLRSGKSPYPELDADGQLPSRPSSSDTLSSDTPSLDTSTYPEIKPEQLAEQALDLAHSHQLAARPGRDRLLARLDGQRARFTRGVPSVDAGGGRATDDSARRRVAR